VLDFERNVPFQIQSDDVHTAIILSTFLVVFGRYAFVEISENVVRIVIFAVVKHYRDKNSDSVLLICRLQLLHKAPTNFSRAMVVMPDFVIIF
jgi:hypothetical protein